MIVFWTLFRSTFAASVAIQSVSANSVSLIEKGYPDAFDPQQVYAYIEDSFPKVPTKAIFSCMWNFSSFEQYGIIPIQPSLPQCDNILETAKCILIRGLAPPTPYEGHFVAYHKCANMSRMSATLVPILKTCFDNAGEGAIGFPTQYYETTSWHQLRKLYGYPVAISPKKSMRILEDKISFQAYMNKIGLGDYMPKQYTNISEVKYPCILKLRPRTGTNSKGVKIVFKRKELRDYLAGNKNDEPYLLQEAVNASIEVAFNFVAYRGQLLNKTLCHILYNDLGKVTILSAKLYRFRINNGTCSCLPGYTTITRVLQTLVSKLQINGIGFVDLKIVNENTIKLLELNARIGGGIHKLDSYLAKFLRIWHLAHQGALYNVSYPIFM